MADNVALATGSGGATIAADELVIGTATVSVQRIKIAYGSTESFNEVATDLPLPVRIEGTRIEVDTAAGATDSGLVFLAIRDDSLSEITATDGDYAQLRTSSDGALWVKTSTAVTLATGDVIDVSVATTATHAVEVQNTATVSLTATGLDPLSNAIATGINTETTLVSGGTYTSTAEDVSEYSVVTTEIITDRPSTTDGMRFEFSSDGTNFDDVYRFTMSTGTATAAARRFQFPVCAQYYRVNYETTSTATQGVFRVQTILHKRNTLTSIHRLVDDMSPDRSAQVVKTAIFARTSGAGDFKAISANAAGNLQIGGSVGVEEWTATESVNLATTATMPVTVTNTSIAITQATESIVTQDTATDLNVTVATGNVFDVSVATTATQPVSVQNTATVAITGTVAMATTATQAVTITNASLPVTVATEVQLATGNVIDVSAATTATQPVTIVNTATVSLATDNVIDVSAATTATQPVTIVNTSTNNVLQATATSLNAITFNQVQRSNVVWGHLTTTATTAATVATGVSNSYNDLSALYITNAGTGAVGISIRDTSTSTMFNHELAADGGGVAMTFPNPLPQSQQATGWVIVLDAAPTANVSVSAAFLTVT